jgi:hypothetical protein
MDSYFEIKYELLRHKDLKMRAKTALESKIFHFLMYFQLAPNILSNFPESLVRNLKLKPTCLKAYYQNDTVSVKVKRRYWLPGLNLLGLV